MKPTEQVPDLKISLINETQWELKKQKPENFILIVFYRGLHCPVCKKYLEDLKTKIDGYTEAGVNLIAISMDSEERAKKAGETWDIDSLPVGYNLSEDDARAWGLYISNAIKDDEPKVFSEPGLFLIKPDGSLYCSSVQTMPFARPDFEELLKSIKFILKKDYPARGKA